jgi:hypothetical protein
VVDSLPSEVDPPLLLWAPVSEFRSGRPTCALHVATIHPGQAFDDQKLSIGETVGVVMSSPMGRVAWIAIPELGLTRATVQARSPRLGCATR